MLLKLGYFTKQTRNTWKVVKCSPGEGCRRSIWPIVWDVRKCYVESRRREVLYRPSKEGRLTGCSHPAQKLPSQIRH